MSALYEMTVSLPDTTPRIYPILQIMEAAAGAHIQALGFSRDKVLERYGAVWMIARAQASFVSPPQSELPLTVRTWLEPLSRGIFYRDFDLLQGGRLIGEAVQAWVLVDCSSRRMLRMDAFAELRGIPVPFAVKSLRLGRIKSPGPLCDAPALCAGKDALDENGHINNAAYVPLALAQLSSDEIQTLKLCYHRECFAGQTLPRKIYEGEKCLFVQLSTPEAETAFELLAEFF